MGRQYPLYLVTMIPRSPSPGAYAGTTRVYKTERSPEFKDGTVQLTKPEEIDGPGWQTPPTMAAFPLDQFQCVLVDVRMVNE